MICRFALAIICGEFSQISRKVYALSGGFIIFLGSKRPAGWSAATRPKNLRARKERAKADQNARPSLFRLGFRFYQSSPLLLTNQNFTLLKFSEATRRFAIFARSVSGRLF